MEKISKFGEVELPEGTEFTLEIMFKAKETLLAEYFNQGKLKFDWTKSNIHERETQNWIRETMGCLQEEIFEAKTILDATLELAHGLSEQLRQDQHLLYREEQADILHFWIELFIFSGLDHSDILYYYDALFKERNFYKPQTPDGFALAMSYAHHQLFPIRPASPLMALSSTLVVEQYGNKYLLLSLKYLNVARNQLKNKYWKSSEVETNKEQYINLLMESFIYYTLYMAVMGFGHAEVVKDYLTKNLINQERINKGW